MYPHIRIRIDVQDTLLHDFRLIFSDRLSCGNDLAVQVRQTDLVIVDQVKGAHAAAHQSLTDISAHAADTKYRHSRIRQPFHCILPQQ